MLTELFEEAIGIPPGKGFSGLYQSCCMLTVGLKMVDVKVTGLPELQVIAWLVGATVVVGAIVLIPIATVCCIRQPVAGSETVKVKVLATPILTVDVLAVKEGLVQL
jgi:hypothetical protein